MTLREEFLQLLLEGSFSKFSLTPKSAFRLYRWCLENDIVDPLKPDQLHLSFIYSSETDISPSEYKEHKEPIVLEPPFEIDIFKKFGNTVSLVILNDQKLQKMIRSVIDKYKIKQNFPKYRPHITLSYNGIGNKHLEGKLEPPNFPIVVYNEKFEPFVTDARKKIYKMKEDAGGEVRPISTTTADIAVPEWPIGFTMKKLKNFKGRLKRKQNGRL